MPETQEQKRRFALAERFRDKKGHRKKQWFLPNVFFGDVGFDIHDFEEYNYTYFLDHVRSREDLLAGLTELSPFADDALAVAETMNDLDFCNFKLALIHERRVAKGEEDTSKMPKKFVTILLPVKFIVGAMIAKECDVALGAALVRIEEERIKGE